MKPRIAITLGDLAGIGPEIVSKALRDPRVFRVCEPIVIGRNERLKKGAPSRAAGRLAIEALRHGFALVQHGRAEALVTAPVSKESFRLANYGFPGHTEWLAKACQAQAVAMLMVAGSLRAILMTRHIPLKEVPKHLSPRLVRQSAKLGCDFMKTCGGGVRKPRLVLCGLNPHAGDHGLIGREEQFIFLPALRALKKGGVDVAGPVPADVVFCDMAEGRYDLALAAYHDQGMVPLKLHAPNRIVNITLGLPFIRTAPGHGTAYDIAGKGIANPGPMIEAILLAAKYSLGPWPVGRDLPGHRSRATGHEL